MPKLHLTDTLCKKLPAPDRRHRIYYDNAVPMFGLCVTARGARSFLVRYRRKTDGVERSMVIGDFPTSDRRGARCDSSCRLAG
jgi:Arm DNA-binding domain